MFYIFYKSGVTVIEKVTETKLSALIISNVVVCIASTSGKVGSASAFLGTLGIVDISDIKQSFNYDKSISIDSMANQEIIKNYSNLLTERQLLRLIYYYCLVCALLILPSIQKIYL